MNRQNLERKEVRLGLAQVIGLLGLIFGSIIAAFGLGYYSGRTLNFERELSNALAGLPKLPVNSEESAENLGDKIVSEVYAKLNEQVKEPLAEATAGVVVPELGTIREADGTGDFELENDLPLPGESVENETLGGADSEDMPLADEKTLAAILEESADHKPSAAPTPKVAAEPTKEAAPVKDVNSRAAVKESQPPKQIQDPKEKQDSKGKAEYSVKEEPIRAAVKEQPEARVKPPVPAIAPQKSIAKGWYAQIAAPKLQADASQLASQLKRSGFAAVIETAEVRGEKYFRVLTGPEKSKGQAEALLKQLKREPYVTGAPFLRVVK